MKTKSAPGREFENEVANFLRAAGFSVTINARVAKPRQTDLFAKGDEADLLVEVKEQKRKIDVGDIDSLRSRLNRTSADIVGIIFSSSDLTNGAIEAIEADRRREIIAFVGAEIAQLRSARQNLIALIERKRNELRVHGRAWFGSETKLDYVDVKLPLAAVQFALGDERKPYFGSRSSFSGAVYSLHLVFHMQKKIASGFRVVEERSRSGFPLGNIGNCRKHGSMILWIGLCSAMAKFISFNRTASRRNARRRVSTRQATNANARAWVNTTVLEMTAVGSRCLTPLQLVGVIEKLPADCSPRGGLPSMPVFNAEKP